MKYVKFLSFLTVLLFTGCVQETINSQVSRLGANLSTQTYEKTVTQTAPKSTHFTSKEDYSNRYKNLKNRKKTKDLIWLYNMGTLGFYNARYPESINHFDTAENLINNYDREVAGGKLLASMGSLLSNDNFLDYRPKIYEKIMVNTFKGMDFILAGDKKNARVEFNRALVRQQRAKIFFSKEIAQEKKKIEQNKKKDKKSLLIDKILKDRRTLDPIEKEYSNLFAFKPYPDFINPFSTYLAGIYFLNVKDYRKAVNLLKESYGMIKGLDPGYKYVLDDFKTAYRLKRSLKARRKKYTWVIFLNGKSPVKIEKKIEIPLFLLSDDIFYTGIALPSLQMNPAAFDYLSVSNGLNRPLKTKRVASMDRIIKTEFKKRFNTVVTRALMRTATQTVVQKQLKDKLGFFGALGAAVYQSTMNKADLRSWNLLPKEFQTARIRTGKKIIIKTPKGTKIASIKTDPKKNYIIFVTIPSNKSIPVVSYRSF